MGALPEIFLIVFHPVFLEERHVFLLKSFDPMMQNLIRDVILNRLAIGHAHGEGSVSRLPTEIFYADRFVDPARGGLFYILDERSQRMRRPQTNQQMNMICHAADGFRNSIRCTD